MDGASAWEQLDHIKKIEYWESVRTWFEEQGYFLYENVDEGDQKYEYAKPAMDYPETPPMIFSHIVEDPFPYAFMGPGDLYRYTGRPRYSTREKIDARVMFAQDATGRHVAIKKLKTTDEYQVLQLLKDQPRLRDPDSFPSVIPILDLLQHDGDSFAVMPRWELNLSHDTFFPTLHIAIRYLVSLLEGLVFLHDLRIFHRDLCTKNTLVNHIASTWSFSLSRTEYHRHLKSIGALRYAIMDFDLAMVLQEKTYGLNPRLPIHLVADIGNLTRPYEAIHGYVDFDPFKYDVACLGIEFSHYFQQIIPDVPLLAPLIDRMITSDIDKRFTASEALEFARKILPSVSTVARFERTPEMGIAYHRADRWAGLSKSFIVEWGSYRENNSSRAMRLQNWLFFRTSWGWRLMHYFRYTVHALTFVPRFIFRCISLPARAQGPLTK